MMELLHGSGLIRLIEKWQTLSLNQDVVELSPQVFNSILKWPGVAAVVYLIETLWEALGSDIWQNAHFILEGKGLS